MNKTFFNTETWAPEDLIDPTIQKYLNEFNIRQQQLTGASKEQNYSYYSYIFLFIIVEYYLNVFEIDGDADFELLDFIRSFLKQVILNGSAVIFSKNNKIHIGTIQQKYTTKAIIQTLNFESYADFEATTFELKHSEYIECCFNTLKQSAYAKWWRIVQPLDKFIKLAISQLTWKNNKLVVKSKKENLKKLQTELMASIDFNNLDTPCLFLPEDLDISKLETPDVDINEYFKWIKSWIYFFFWMTGLPTFDSNAESGRDIQASQSIQADYNTIALHEWKYQLILFIHRFNHRFGTNLNIKQVEESTTYSAKVEKGLYKND